MTFPDMPLPSRHRDTLMPQDGHTLMSGEANKSDQPGASHRILRPSQEVQAKMRPLARASFEQVLKRAARPIQRRASKAK